MTNETETTDDPKEAEHEEPSFDAVDLMLEGNLKEQISYSMVKAFAKATDEKAQILIQAEEGFEPQEGESFAEVAMRNRGDGSGHHGWMRGFFKGPLLGSL